MWNEQAYNKLLKKLANAAKPERGPKRAAMGDQTSYAKISRRQHPKVLTTLRSGYSGALLFTSATGRDGTVAKP